MTQFAFEPIYGSWLVAVLAAAAIVAVIVLLTPPTVNRTHRRWLIGLRVLAAAVLLLTVFRPALVRTDRRPAPASLVVAVDRSQSMTLPDGEGSDRWTTQQQAWQQLARGLERLDRSLNVRLLAYDRDARPLEDVGPDALKSIEPEGDLTDLSAATSASMQVAAGEPLAGIVVMGDGTQTAPSGPRSAEQVVETLDSLGVPLWSVPIGPAGGATEARDVAVEALPESYQLFAGNEVDIEFEMRLRGFAGSEVPVRLSWIDEAGEAEEVAIRGVVAEKSLDTAAVSVPLIAPEPGSYRLQVQADLQPGELVSKNNSQVAFVDVREGGGRVLYLEGTARLEQTFLRRALRRFPDLDLTYRWIAQDTSQRWPIDLNDWFEPGKFDIYIIGDLDADAIGDQQLQQLADAVAAGAGLVTLGGFQTYGPGGYADSPLAEVMPVRMNPALRRRGAPSGEDAPGQITGPLPIRLARSHPVTELGEGDPSAVWQGLPELPGANRLVGPKPVPGVQVLLETPEEDPLLVIGEYGRGRTAAVAFDSTWRWWRAGFDEQHRQFWRQLVLWLLGRDTSEGNQINIELDARRFASGDPPAFRAGVQTLGEEVDVELIAEVIDGQGNQRNVQVTAAAGTSDEPATIRGELPELEPGFYKLRVRAADAESPLDPAFLAFQVVDESRELAQPMADPVYLRQLADLTADHGGAAFTPDQMDRLLDVIAQRRRRAETTIVEKLRLGDGPISGWLLFVVFGSALSVEWWLRRRWGLA